MACGDRAVAGATIILRRDARVAMIAPRPQVVTMTPDAAPDSMHPTSAFLAPLAKSDRAKTQIQELSLAIRSFFEFAPYKIVSEIDTKADEEVWRFQLMRKLPAELSVRTGEIFHNLRSALDQMLAEIVARISKRSESGVEFPFGLNIDEFETALRKQKKLPAEAIPMIRDLKPYKGGDALLWLLHSTNRRDKHRMGLVPINLRTAGEVSYLSIWYGQALVIGSRSGQHLVAERKITDADYIRLAARGRAWGLYGLSILDPVTGLPIVPDRGHRLVFNNPGPGAPAETMEFLTATPGTKFKTDFKPSFDIAFGNVGGLEREPVVYVLTQLRDVVERAMLQFRDRFFPQ
jgi:hypothetical protein